jgi:hypothetical protein
MSFPIVVPTATPYRGDTFVMSYVFKSGDPLTPIDFVDEGWDDWKAQFRTSEDATDFIEFTIDDAEADQGRINLSMTATQTVDLTNGVWDLQATRGAELRTWIRGNLKVIEDVTRA